MRWNWDLARGVCVCAGEKGHAFVCVDVGWLWSKSRQDIYIFSTSLHKFSGGDGLLWCWNIDLSNPRPLTPLHFEKHEYPH